MDFESLLGASMAQDYAIIGVGLVGAILLFGLGWVFCSRVKARQVADLQEESDRRVAKLAERADRDRREALLEEKNAWYESKSQYETELDRKRKELEKREIDLDENESDFSVKKEALSNRAKGLTRRERDNQRREEKLARQNDELGGVLMEQRLQLERISGMNAEHAQEMLLEKIRNDLQRVATEIGREKVEQAKEQADREAKRIIASAIERCSTDQTVQSSISVVPLPDDDIKGRIVGKEGRNIISFEAATGVKVIVNDTPEAVVLSSFDPVKRDVARLAMEALVKEGRINPGRVEEVVVQCEKKIEATIEEEGKRTVKEVGIDDMHPELVKLVGKLKYRTSFGQGMIGHCKEVAFLAGAMAAELRLNQKMARRCAMLHDIGKSIDHEQEGSHVDIGVEVARKYGEGEEVINSILYHHEEAEPLSPISFLVKAADAISSSRPGARRDDAEGYIKRVRELEDLARAFNGVRDAYAINAGREVRVMVNAGRISDDEAKNLSFEIAQKVREDLTFPGEIQVTVIRQTVATGWAGRPNKKRRGRSRNRRGDRRNDKSRSRNDADRKNVSSGDNKGAVADLQAPVREEGHHAVSRRKMGKAGRISRPPQANKGRSGQT
ncbi:MAG: ribonuclease Y [Candidatus Latescibacterota bacterium]|nr:ribonuclease Y [Candidatus Latescibacterota bacterium]